MRLLIQNANTLQCQRFMVSSAGIEPATLRLGGGGVAFFGVFPSVLQSSETRLDTVFFSDLFAMPCCPILPDFALFWNVQLADP